MIWGTALFVLGLGLSAFFSGTETGMYRVPRTRLMLDALSGNRVARGLVWLLNRPSFFVATALIGNNVANYLASAAIVLFVAALASENPTAELLGPILMTPIVFVLGELMPKHLFFRMPYRLLSFFGPLLLLAATIFAPISMLLAYLGNQLQKATGQTPFASGMRINQGAIRRMLRDGHESGLLAAGQRHLAGRLFEVGDRPASQFGVPVDRLAIIDAPIDRSAAMAKARRVNHPLLLVRRGGRIVGCLNYVDLLEASQTDSEAAIKIRKVLHGRTGDRHLRMLVRMYDSGTEVAVMHDPKNRVSTVVTRQQLIGPLTRMDAT